MKPLAIVIATSLCIGAAALLSAQSSQNRVLGREISGRLALDGRNQLSMETMTLTFRPDNGGPTFTVDFTARRSLQPSAPPPDVVDITVTQHPVEDDTPQMTLRADGQSVSLITRVKSRRSIVSTISFSDFLRLAAASSIVENAFMSDLEFGPAQLGLLRSTAGRW
jgi:hypothetical protein